MSLESYDPDRGLVTITTTEYHVLQKDSRRVKAIEAVIDEFLMRRKLWRDGQHDGKKQLCALRGRTLAQITNIMKSNWKG